jgi:PTS system mannose-specific IIB component/fructoselysine and glucoselysine-specific PTS system IIB component
MPIVLLRLDERLIHGQVVVGWGAKLHVKRMVVISAATARHEWAAWQQCPEAIILLVRTVDALAALADGRFLEGQPVNLGGLHHAEGREQALPYLYFTPGERRQLEAVAAGGAILTARDLPTSRAVPLADLST